MAHCPIERLADLPELLEELRTWPQLRENSPGVFYYKRIPFLHFHVKGEERWADVREGKTWGPPIPVPFAPSAATMKAVLKEIRRRLTLMGPQ